MIDFVDEGKKMNLIFSKQLMEEFGVKFESIFCYKELCLVCEKGLVDGGKV